MKRYISLLRGINVTGYNVIKMLDLKELYETTGFIDVETYLQSGNVVFSNPGDQDINSLARYIEMQIELRFALNVPVLINDSDEFKRIIATNPFLENRHEEPSKLYVTFLDRAPDRMKVAELSIPSSGQDEFEYGEKEIFLFCPTGYGRTKLSNTFFEKKLGVIATTRNWNTVLALYKMVSYK